MIAALGRSSLTRTQMRNVLVRAFRNLREPIGSLLTVIVLSQKPPSRHNLGVNYFAEHV